MRHGYPWRVQTDGVRGKSMDVLPLAPQDEFDELVVGTDAECWLHIERMGTSDWWMRIGSVCLGVHREPRRGTRAARWRVTFIEVRDDGPGIEGVRCSKCGHVED